MSTLADDAVLPPVASQPSFPFPMTTEHKQLLRISDRELAKLKAK
jgi:hypothetical protein